MDYEILGSGAYVLFYPETNLVRVGEAEILMKRLRQHYSSCPGFRVIATVHPEGKFQYHPRLNPGASKETCREARKILERELQSLFPVHVRDSFYIADEQGMRTAIRNHGLIIACSICKADEADLHLGQDFCDDCWEGIKEEIKEDSKKCSCGCELY